VRQVRARNHCFSSWRCSDITRHKRHFRYISCTLIRRGYSARQRMVRKSRGVFDWELHGDSPNTFSFAPRPVSVPPIPWTSAHGSICGSSQPRHCRRSYRSAIASNSLGRVRSFASRFPIGELFLRDPPHPPVSSNSFAVYHFILIFQSRCQKFSPHVGAVRAGFRCLAGLGQNCWLA
jgi:hypothetical protein